jgi:transposase
MQNSTVVAVNVAKTIFEVAVSERPGHVCRRDRPTRAQFLAFFLAYPAATVVMEACGSAHYWGRELQKRSHRVCYCRLTRSGATCAETRPIAPTPCSGCRVPGPWR